MNIPAKNTVAWSLLLTVCLSVLRCTPVYASDNEAIPSSYDDPTIVISEPMTYEEMAEHFAQENDVEYSTAFRTLPQ